MKLLPHQQKFKDKNPDKALLVWEGGTGKTIAGAIWLKEGRDDDALVICPKRVVKKWQETLKQWGAKATVLSKENFKKIPIKIWSAIVCDEADEFASPLFTKNRSALSEHLYRTIKLKDVPVLLLTATPIRSNPYNLHTLLCFMNYYVDWKKWRETFFSLEFRPYLPRPAWLPRSNWQKLIRPTLEKHAQIVLLKDCVDYLPPVTEECVLTHPGAFKGSLKWSDEASFVDEHRFEQTDKHKSILEIVKEYRKVLVVAYFVEQVKELEKQLSKERQTFVIHGGIKDQEQIIKDASESDECFFIVQANIGSGFDADTFSVVIFASLSYGVRNLVQMKYRVRRIHNLHPVRYIFLLGGRCDKIVKKTVDSGRDFIPSEYIRN